MSPPILSFSGHCLYGLYEVGYPVVINGTVAAIVYVGNAVVDERATRRRLEKECARTGIKKESLEKELSRCERPDSAAEMFQLAELVSDYLKLLYERAPRDKASEHWLVSLMKHYADEMYETPLSLKELAVTCQKNEKYIGRRFASEVGVSFHRYCNELRLQKAEQLLRCGDDKIIDIAFSCGFNSVSYFNRLFWQKHGMSPRAYRAGQTLLPTAEPVGAPADFIDAIGPQNSR